jgi:hypothetical protein
MKKYLVEDSYSLKWVSFYPKFNSSLYVEKAGYFDERPLLHTSVTQLAAIVLIPILAYISSWALFLLPFIILGWGKLKISLPIHTGILKDESETYGFHYHDDSIFIYVGIEDSGTRKFKYLPAPWSLDWVRTSTIMKDGSWHIETGKNKIKWSEEDIKGSHKWLNRTKWQESHPFIDSYDNKTVTATISMAEIERRPICAKWTSLFAQITRKLHIEFSEEVGRGKGGYKGGTTGFSCTINKDETPYDCLKRIEREYKF